MQNIIQVGSDFFCLQSRWNDDIMNPGALAEFMTIDFPGVVFASHI